MFSLFNPFPLLQHSKAASWPLRAVTPSSNKTACVVQPPVAHGVPRKPLLAPLACSLSPSPQPQRSAKDELGDGDSEQGQLPSVLHAEPAHSAQAESSSSRDSDEDAGSDGDGYSEEEDDDTDDSGGGSNSVSRSLATMLQNALLPKVFTSICSDGSIAQATYTR